MAGKKFPGLWAEVGVYGKVCVLMVGGDGREERLPPIDPAEDLIAASELGISRPSSRFLSKNRIASAGSSGRPGTAPPPAPQRNAGTPHSNNCVLPLPAVRADGLSGSHCGKEGMRDTAGIPLGLGRRTQ